MSTDISSLRDITILNVIFLLLFPKRTIFLLLYPLQQIKIWISRKLRSQLMRNHTTFPPWIRAWSTHQTSLSHDGDIAHPTGFKQVYWPIPLYIFETAFSSIQLLTLNKTLSKIFLRFLALRKFYAYIWLRGPTGYVFHFLLYLLPSPGH